MEPNQQAPDTCFYVLGPFYLVLHMLDLAHTPHPTTTHWTSVFTPENRERNAQVSLAW